MPYRYYEKQTRREADKPRIPGANPRRPRAVVMVNNNRQYY